MIVCEEGTANTRISRNHTVAECVIRGAPMRFVPTGGEFIAQAQRKCQLGTDAKNIFGVKRSEHGTPIQRRGRRVVQERRRSALQKSGQAGESGLSVLAKRDVFVGLELLKPCAETELVTAFGQG